MEPNFEYKLNPEISNWRSKPEADAELIEDIKKHGQAGKIIFRKLQDGSLELVYGHRRLDACKKAGVQPAYEVRENLSEADAMLLALSENLYRKDLAPIEEARAFNSLKKQKFSTKQIAEHVQRNEEFVKQRLNLLKIPEKIVDKIEEGKLPLFSAAQLSKLNDKPDVQLQVAKDFAERVRRGYSNTEKDLEHEVAEVLAKAKKREELLAKYRPCPKCGSKRVWRDNYNPANYLECEECGLKYEADTKNPWELVELKKEAKKLGMNLEVVDGKGVVLTPEDLVALTPGKPKKLKLDFRSTPPLENWVAALIERANNIKSVDVDNDHINITLIEGTGLHFKGNRQTFKTGPWQAKIHVQKPYAYNEDTTKETEEQLKAVHTFYKAVAGGNTDDITAEEPAEATTKDN